MNYKILLELAYLISEIGMFFYKGLAVMVIWNWFVPEIVGFAELTYGLALGLLTVVYAVNMRHSPIVDHVRRQKLKKEKTEEELSELELTANMYLFINLNLLILIAFVIKLIVG